MGFITDVVTKLLSTVFPTEHVLRFIYLFNTLQGIIRIRKSTNTNELP